LRVRLSVSVVPHSLCLESASYTVSLGSTITKLALPTLDVHSFRALGKLGTQHTNNVYELRLYPGFRVPDESAATLGTRGLKEMKRNQCYELQKALRSGTKVDTQTKYFVLLPGIKAHEAFHPTSGAACFAQKIHPKLVEKVHELVAEGITDV